MRSALLWFMLAALFGLVVCIQNCTSSWVTSSTSGREQLADPFPAPVRASELTLAQRVETLENTVEAYGTSTRDSEVEDTHAWYVSLKSRIQDLEKLHDAGTPR